MSVLSYLEKTVGEIKIADWERKSIQTSINALMTKLGNNVPNLNSKFVFGSFDRNTILRRSKDENSDVDAMVVFNDGGSFKPQTLINRLKTFTENNYKKNEIYQSYPTIVLELSKIKFELVPAYISWGTYYIPAPASSLLNWTSTNPNKMKQDLISKQQSNDYKIRELILLIKYWNIKNGRIYSSFELEKFLVSYYYFSCSNLKDYFYSAIQGLSTSGLSIANRTKVNRAKQIIKNTIDFENKGQLLFAEIEIIKMFI